VFIVESVYFVINSVRKLLDTPSYFVCAYGENGGRKIIQNVGILSQHYTSSQPRRSRLTWIFTAVNTSNLAHGGSLSSSL